MRARAKPLPWPDESEPQYLRVEHPDLPSPHLFRMPRIKVLGELIQGVDIAGMVSAIPDGAPALDVAFEVAALGDDIGALVGACWHHPELELETERAKGETLADYGARVSQELADAGYTMLAQWALACAIYPQVLARMTAAAPPTKEQFRDFRRAGGTSTGSS